MRIKGKLDLIPFTAGKVDIIIDNIEDLWALYNIIQRGDFIKTAMFRKIQHETGGGKVTSTKKKLIITIKIEEITYDQTEGILRFKGKNVSENEDIAIGQYQTAEISKGAFFSLYKKCWDELNIETIKATSDSKITSDVAAIIMEEGVAHLYFITNSLTTLQGKITQNIPKKRNGSSGHDKSKKEFFSKILNQLVKQINFENIKCVIIASPGFTKDEFGDYMAEQIENNWKMYESIKVNNKKFVYVHSSSGYKQSLDEVLGKPDIKCWIKNTKASEDTVIMDKFNEVLGKDMDKAFFGMSAFEIANEKDAIDTLIITDNFLRKISPTLRKKVSMAIKGLRAHAVNVHKLSSQHVTGEKIDSFGGIVGILKYVLPEITELGVEGLEIEDFENEEELNEDDTEQFQEMLNNNMNYNDEDIEDKEEDEKKDKDPDKTGKGKIWKNKDEADEEDGKQKEKAKEKHVGSKQSKKTKIEMKNTDINRKKNQRKRSSVNQREEEEDYE